MKNARKKVKNEIKSELRHSIAYKHTVAGNKVTIEWIQVAIMRNGDTIAHYINT